MSEGEDHDRLVILETQFAEYRRAMEERLMKLNELREQVTSDRESFLRNDVYVARHEDLRRRMETVDEASRSRHDTLEKEMRSRMESNYGELDKRIDQVKDACSTDVGLMGTRITQVEARKEGAQSNSVLIGGAVAVVLMVLALMGWIASHNQPTQVVVPGQADIKTK